MQKTLTVLKSKVVHIVKLKVCVCSRNYHEKMKRAARHQQIQTETVHHEDAEPRATVVVAVDLQLVPAVGGAKRGYGIQGIWHTANGAETIG